jgi:cytosine/adenosine deaminase-related metal-dependent hydrolase
MLVPPPGTTGIRLLAEAGLLDSNVVAAHCVEVDEEEIALLAEHDVAVAHCPRSNGILGCGVAPLTALREAGLRVCIATDSPASTPSFDMFDEMRAAIVGARAREERPDALTAADALELATLGGARALGLDASVGSLVPGKSADLTVLSLADTPFIPWEDPVTGAVLGGSPHGVVATLVSGKPRYEKGGKTWLELIDAARSARGRLLQHAGPKS